jgi:bacteriocin-like protein
MEKIDANTKFEDIEITDYPYIGIGKKPLSNKRKLLTDDELERIIGG